MIDRSTITSLYPIIPHSYDWPFGIGDFHLICKLTEEFWSSLPNNKNWTMNAATVGQKLQIFSHFMRKLILVRDYKLQTTPNVQYCNWCPAVSSRSISGGVTTQHGNRTSRQSPQQTEIPSASITG